ncbi:MAG TPA: ABC transporter permease [Cyclobacteriaceae bacterium]
MLKNYLTTALRIMLRQQGFTIINILGLTIGIACSLLLIIYINHELSFDRFHKDSDRIYRIGFEGKLQGDRFLSGETGAPLAAVFQKDLPAIQSTLRLANWPTFPVRYKDKAFTEPYLLIADSNFFSFFDFELIEGSPAAVLKGKDKLVISESTAKRLFDYKGPGDQTPIGKSIMLAQGYSAKVTGIAKDTPANSHFHYSIILSMASWAEVEQGGWLNRLVLTYFKLKPGHSVSEVESQYEVLINKYVDEELQKNNHVTLNEFKKQGNSLNFFTQSISSIHLNSWLDDEIEINGNLQYIYLFGAVALFITALACINFMNLSTARSASRAKEVGVRKAVGAVQRRLIFQFLFESYLYVIIAVLLAILLVWITLLPFNILSGKHLTMDVFLEPQFMLSIFVFMLIVGAAAGSYPAFYLSFFNPMDVLKGQLRSGRNTYSLRNTLVVFQFFISIVLIIATMVVYQQLRYIQQLNVGFNSGNIINLLHTANLKQKAVDFKKELLSNKEIISASYANRLPPNVDWQSVFRVEGKKTNHLLGVYEMDEDHLKTMGYVMESGRFFSPGTTPNKNEIILNQTAIKKMGIKNRDSVKLSSNYDADTSFRRTVIGVIRDFNFKSLKDSIQPLAVVPSRVPNLEMAIRITHGNTSEKLEQIKTLWQKYAPDAPFEYTFIDQNFKTKYEDEKKVGEVFIIFTLLAILIACLGLFGLATYATEQRTKEIGIRKAIGAQPITIVLLLTKDLTRLIAIAFVIAAPVAWFTLNYWLNYYPYRIQISPWIILSSGLLACSIGLFTIVFKAWSAASANPVKALRNE